MKIWRMMRVKTTGDDGEYPTVSTTVEQYVITTSVEEEGELAEVVALHDDPEDYIRVNRVADIPNEEDIFFDIAVSRRIIGKLFDYSDSAHTVSILVTRKQQSVFEED